MKHRVTATITEEFYAEDKDEALEMMAGFIRAEAKPGDYQYEVEEISEGGEDE